MLLEMSVIIKFSLPHIVGSLRSAETNYGARGRPNMGLLYFYLYFTATINLNFVVYSIFNRRNIMQYLHNVWQYIVKIR